MSGPEDNRESHGPLDSARSVMESVLSLIGKRFELAAVEMEEGKYRLMDHLLRLAVVGVLGLMAVFVATFFIIAATWETPARLYVIAGLAIVYGVAAWRVYLSLKRSVEDSPPPFAATLAELRKDREWFQKKN